jgi:cell shape-determining protein MreC
MENQSYYDLVTTDIRIPIKIIVVAIATPITIFSTVLSSTRSRDGAAVVVTVPNNGAMVVTGLIVVSGLIVVMVPIVGVMVGNVSMVDPRP